MPEHDFSSLHISTARWHNNADSPVVLLIEGLNNALCYRDNSEVVEAGIDCGYHKNTQTSTWHRFYHDFVKKFKEAHLTLFWTVDTRYGSDVPENVRSTTHQFEPREEAFISFLKSVSSEHRIEIAYGGRHFYRSDATGSLVVGEYEAPEMNEEDFLQRYSREGFELFFQSLGYYPRGGIFPGFGKWQKATDFLAELDEPPLSYWCDVFTPYEVSHQAGSSAFDIHFLTPSFAGFPTTVEGNAFQRENIDFLLKYQKPISIIESFPRFSHHGVITPNLIDDIDTLTDIYSYLDSQNVWHAGIPEIITYARNYYDIFIERLSANSFTLSSKTHRSFRYDDSLTLNLQGLDEWRDYSVHLPSGGVVRVDNRLELFRTVTVPVQEGEYTISAVS